MIALLSLFKAFFSKKSLKFSLIFTILSSLRYSLNFSIILFDCFNPPSNADDDQKYEDSKS